MEALGGGVGWGLRGYRVRGLVPATDLCRFLFFRFLWLLWWLPEEVEEAAFWGFTPCTDPSRSSGSSWLGSFSWLWKSGEVSLSVPLPGSPGGNKHKSPEVSSESLEHSVSQERSLWALICRKRLYFYPHWPYPLIDKMHTVRHQNYQSSWRKCNLKQCNQRQQI